MSRPNIKRPNSVILPDKTDSFVPNTRPMTISRSMTHIDSLKDGVNIDNIQPIKKWTYLDNSNKSSAGLPDRVININMNEPLSEKVYFHQPKPQSPSKVKENTRLLVAKNLTTKQNSTDCLLNKLEGEAKTGTDFQTFSTKCETHPVTSQTRSETNRIIYRNNIGGIDTTRKLFNDREDNSKNPSLKGSEIFHSALEYSEETKMEMQGDSDKMCEDETSFDDIWKSYVERPVLPLKPLQKQRSLSCTNLVQTIKGLSKRKTGANNRFSSPENTLFESKELCTSEANISNMPTRKISKESEDQNFRRFRDSNDSCTTKRERQSLQCYLWYHLIDAKEASKRLMKMHQNGSFLIRPASNPTSEVLHTLCVVCSGRVYNFHIRNLENGRITLGTKNERKETFSSLLEMIKYHQTVPITINIAGHMVCVHLLITPPK